MTADRYVIPFGNRVLVLDAATFATALAAGDALAVSIPATAATPAATRLLSAQEMQAATGVAASWFERRARERRIPAHKLGRYWRFDLAEVTRGGMKPAQASVSRGNGTRSGRRDR